jgi:hypothetical protein
MGSLVAEKGVAGRPLLAVGADALEVVVGGEAVLVLRPRRHIALGRK